MNLIFRLFLACLFYTLNIIHAEDIILNQSISLSKPIALSYSQKIYCKNSLVISGNGHNINFSSSNYPLFFIDRNSNISFKNIILKNFSEQNISLGDQSSITFGKSCIVELKNDQFLNKDYLCQDKCAIMGNGNSISLKDGSIKVLSHGQLTISNTTLTNVSNKNFGCVDETGSISFENVIIAIPSGTLWDHSLKSSKLTKAKTIENDNTTFFYGSAQGINFKIALNIEPIPQPKFLKYGDLFSLKNNSYGFYLGYSIPVDYQNGWLQFVGRNLPSPNDSVQFYAQQDDTPNRWGATGGYPSLYNGSKIEKPVRSGDIFRFERFYSPSQIMQVNPNSRMPFCIFDQPAPTSIGNCFKRAAIGISNAYYSYIVRIYKKGGCVGDPIAENDSVYFAGYKQPYPGEVFHLSIPTNFSQQMLLSTFNEVATVGNQYYQILSEKGVAEIFAYENNGPVTSFPENIKNNSLWQVVNVTDAGYMGATANDAYKNEINNNVFYDTEGSHNGKGFTNAYAAQVFLPPASLNQF